MGLTTDFNTSPYYDDFDETKNFHRVLFKPGVAVQARELTQLQTILQNQVERFGNNILIEGTIIDGCNFVEITDLKYAKILDLNTNGQPVSMSSFVGQFVYGQTTGIKALIQTYADGLESDGTNLNTIFFKYLTSGTNTDIKTFATSENLIITDSSNTVIDTVTAAGTAIVTPADAVGSAYGVKVGEGIIYQKGFFVGVDEQLAVVSKYSNSPDSVLVGFLTEESIVNSNADTSLLDNANGYNNYQAPGADRLVLTPVLTVMTTTDADLDDKFFAIQEYMSGRVVRRNNATQYNGIADVMEKRTKEESGDYIVNDFNIFTNGNITSIPATTLTIGKSYTIVTPGTTDFVSIGSSSNLSGTIFTATAVGSGTGTVILNTINLTVGAGLAYVEGKRVELLNNYTVDLEKSTTSTKVSDQYITANYGNYVLVNEYMGKFDFNEGGTVYLFDAVQTNSTAGTIGANTGNNIGSATVTSIVPNSGTDGTATATYRMYLTNIQMSVNQNWQDTKAVITTGSTGTADLVTTILYDTPYTRRVFPVGQAALKSLPATGSNTGYISRTSSTVTVTANTATVTAPTGAVWPYAIGVLNSTQKKDLLLIAGATSSPYVINKPIDLSSLTVTVTSSTVLTITGFSVASLANNTLNYNIRYNAISTPTLLTLETVYIKVDCSTHAANSAGPWSLGVPNVYSIEDVYVGTGSYPTETTANSQKSKFVLNNNQQSAFYGLSSIRARPGTVLGSTSRLLIKVKVFKKGSVDKGFYSVSSYPIDNINLANTAAITSDRIPVYLDRISNEAIELRNSIDFRLYASNTAVYASTSGAASINPSDVLTLDTNVDLKLPAPNAALITDYDYYLSRKDLFFINEYGDFALKSGVPAASPNLPADPTIGMVLAELTIPPYPSTDVSIVKRGIFNYTMKDINDLDKRLKKVEDYISLSQLEQETGNEDPTNPTTPGVPMIKNAIFVDDLTTLNQADIEDPAWAADLGKPGELVPKLVKHPLLLKYDPQEASTNIKVYQDTLTLATNGQKKLIEQKYATGEKNTSTDTYNVKGKIEIYPSVSYGFTRTDPTWPLFKNNERFWALPNTINIVATGLKANTKYYIFLNKQKVIATPAYYGSTANSITDLEFGYGTRTVTNTYINPDWAKDWPRVTAFAGTVTDKDDIVSADGYYVMTDSDGTYIAQLRIPQGKGYNGLPLGDHVITINESGDAADLTATTAAGGDAKTSITYKAQKTGSGEPSIGSRTYVSSTVTETDVTYTSDAQPFNHICQTFKVDSNAGLDSVVFVSEVDLYFAKKPTGVGDIGVTLEIMATKNNVPDPTKVLASIYISNSTIDPDVNGNTKTTITLPNPVALKTNAVYALAIIADQANPNFKICTAKNGNSDLTNTNTKATFDFIGDCYVGTSGSNWTPLANEKIKFKLYMDKFVKTGSAYLTNRDHEFLTVNNYSSTRTTANPGSFNSREIVAKLNANLTPTFSFSKTSLTVVASSNSVASKFVAGDWLGYWTVDATGNTVIDAVKISNSATAITSNATATTILLKTYPQYTNSTAKGFQTVVGKVNYHIQDDGILHLLDSTASTASTGGVDTWFKAGDTIVGVNTSTTVNIVSVDDLAIGAIDTDISETNYTYTSTKFTTQILKSANTYTTVATDEELTTTAVNDSKYSVVIPSTSRESANSLGEAFRIKVALENTDKGSTFESSPIIDVKNSTVKIWEYYINNDSTTEAGLNSQLGGNSLSRYISKTVTLQENLDAENFVVYLNAYKPPSTSFKVYGRFRNKSDGRDVYDIEWTELVLKSDIVSSATNNSDIRSLEFNMPTVTSTAGLVSGNGAALNLANSNILTYKDKNGALYTGYKDFAIKVVFLTSDKKYIPKLRNIRAIALT